jgi:hypothetical protein
MEPEEVEVEPDAGEHWVLRGRKPEMAIEAVSARGGRGGAQAGGSGARRSRRWTQQNEATASRQGCGTLRRASQQGPGAAWRS